MVLEEASAPDATSRLDLTLYDEIITDYVLDTELVIDGPRAHHVLAFDGEPARVAEAVARMGLKFAVITSVDRDDLKDGGASIFAETITLTRARVPGCLCE